MSAEVVDEPASPGGRGLSPINPPLIALALAIVFLVALLLAVSSTATREPPTHPPRRLK